MSMRRTLSPHSEDDDDDGRRGSGDGDDDGNVNADDQRQDGTQIYWVRLPFGEHLTAL